MKAKELAEELLNYPDFDVELTYVVFERDGIHTSFPYFYNFASRKPRCFSRGELQQDKKGKIYD